MDFCTRMQTCISCCKSVHFNRGSMGDWLTFGDHLRNCMFWHFCIGIIFQNQVAPWYENIWARWATWQWISSLSVMVWLQFWLNESYHTLKTVFKLLINWAYVAVWIQIATFHFPSFCPLIQILILIFSHIQGILVTHLISKCTVCPVRFFIDLFKRKHTERSLLHKTP